ncbi:ATP-dependent RNA helicase dbp4, partial [Tulasnella sp. 331]
TLVVFAAQTQFTKDLAHLSLGDPLYVGVQEKDSMVFTPGSLEHHYVIWELEKKLDVLHQDPRSPTRSSSCQTAKQTNTNIPPIPTTHTQADRRVSQVCFILRITTRNLPPAYPWETEVAETIRCILFDPPEAADTCMHHQLKNVVASEIKIKDGALGVTNQNNRARKKYQHDAA